MHGGEDVHRLRTIKRLPLLLSVLSFSLWDRLCHFYQSFLFWLVFLPKISPDARLKFPNIVITFLCGHTWISIFWYIIVYLHHFPFPFLVSKPSHIPLLFSSKFMASLSLIVVTCICIYICISKCNSLNIHNVTSKFSGLWDYVS